MKINTRLDATRTSTATFCLITGRNLQLTTPLPHSQRHKTGDVLPNTAANHHKQRHVARVVNG